MKVMIATDGSDAAVGAARRATQLLHPDARVELVTVIDTRHDPEEDAGGFEGPVMTEEEADDDWREAKEAGRAAIARTEAVLGGEVDGERVVPTTASVADTIIRLVNEERPDLLVLGSHQPGWFERLLHGSVEDQLLHKCPCPLLIVSRQADGAAE
ncbi:MAG: universal stress protein [Acidimicrobiales bacterium]